ncbi:hypothetical protein BH11PSE3_BH11PSE3_15960 [soil metagenome]
MTFIGADINYGLHPGVFEVWLKAGLVGYLIGVPVLMLIVPHIQRFVMRHAAF